MKNSCYTYFAIRGDFDPDVITKMLGLTPDSFWRADDLKPNGRTEYGFANWRFGKCNEYDLITENQVKKTIEKLTDKIDVLNQIREQFDVTFTIEIVPELYVGETVPALSPDLEIIDFCHATRTEIDIDLYVYED